MHNLFFVVFPILLFVVSEVASQQDPCNLIIDELPRKCNCRSRILRCNGLTDNDVDDLTRAIQGPRRKFKFIEIELADFQFTSLPSGAFVNVDTEYLFLRNGVFNSSNSDSKEFLHSFPTLRILYIDNVETVESKGNWQDFLSVEKLSLESLTIKGPGFSQLWNGFPYTIGPNIIRLQLFNTNVTQLSKSTLSCRLCKEVAFSHGSLNYIQRDTFQNTNNVEVLLLNDNQLHVLVADSLNYLRNIKHVDLSGNQIGAMAELAFYQMNSQAAINLRGQDLKCDCSYKWLNKFSKLTYPDCNQSGRRSWYYKNFFEAYCYV